MTMPPAAVLRKSVLEDTATDIANTVLADHGLRSDVPQLSLSEIIELIADAIERFASLFLGFCGPAMRTPAAQLYDGTAFAKFASNPTFDARVRMRKELLTQIESRGLQGRLLAWSVGVTMARWAAANQAKAAEVFREVQRPDFGALAI